MKALRLTVYSSLAIVTIYLLLFVQPEGTRRDHRVVITYWEKSAGNNAPGNAERRG